VALAECCLAGGLGAAVELGHDLWQTGSQGASGTGRAAPYASPMSVLFGEGSGAFVVSGREEELRALGGGTPVRMLGTVGGEALQIAIRPAPKDGPREALRVTLGELAGAHGSLAELFA
jgi:hypothetical protein